MSDTSPPQDPIYNQPGAVPPSPAGVTGFGHSFGAPVPGGRIAGMGARFGGLVLDALLVIVLTLVVLAVTGGFHLTTTTKCDVAGICTRSSRARLNYPSAIFGIAFTIVYVSYTVGVRTRTFGQELVGIRVVDADTGAPIGIARAFLRWIVLALSTWLCLLGAFSPFFDAQRRQGWHDKAVRSVVIPSPAH